MTAETGRYAILAGWLSALLGVGCYLIAMSRAGPGADIADAFTGQGVVGWASGALLLAGVVIWLLGSIAVTRGPSDEA